MFDLGNHGAAAHAGAFFEGDPRQPAADLDADVAAVARDDVAGRHEDGPRRRSPGGGNDLSRAQHVDLGRAALGDIAAGRRVHGRDDGDEEQQDEPRHPPPPGGRIAVDPQTGKVAPGFSVDGHGDGSQ